MKEFFKKATGQNHPLRRLEDFLAQEEATETAKKYDEMRFVGYVLDIGYDTVTIITSDPFKIAVGGVPRNSLLIMVPSSFDSLPPHFTLLRVLESAPTPLSRDVQQTYFELQKKSMPEVDIFTQSELQWGALKTGVLGMFYPHPETKDTVEFAGDMNNFVSAHKYRIYAPNDDLLDLIVNSIVPKQNQFGLGDLRLTECRLPLPGKPQPDVRVQVSTRDFMATRTAMFGKTRLGKSNVVKLLAQSLIETTNEKVSTFVVSEVTIRTLQQSGVEINVLESLMELKDKAFDDLATFTREVIRTLNGTTSAAELEKVKSKVIHYSTTKVGQLIFDINGEYANDNPQDGNKSLASAYPESCIVYALTPKLSTASKPLKLDFYENPSDSLKILSTLLRESGKTSIYIERFLSVDLPSIETIAEMAPGEKGRAERKILYYWAILNKAGFKTDVSRLKSLLSIDPGFNKKVKTKIWNADETSWPKIETLDDLQSCLELSVEEDRREKLPSSTPGKNLFDADDEALLNFLKPASSTSAGPGLLQTFRVYHDPNAGNFVTEILQLLDRGKTVILDLGNANEEVMRYFSRELSQAVFRNQVGKFTGNTLADHFVQLYFEEAHNLFAISDSDKSTEIYRRFAKEGAKYHIGMVYSTQSPTTVNRDLLAQTENFFIAHLASQDDVTALAKVNIAYESLKGDILTAKTPGYIRMLTRSHRFVVSVQAKKFMPPNVDA